MTRTATALVACGAALIAAGSGGSARSPKQAGRGSIEGRVTFVGTPPPPIIVIESGATQQVLYVDPSGGLRFAVVALAAAPEGEPIPAAEALMNQASYVFVPQVLAVRARQIVRFASDDPANHNVRTQAARPADVFSVMTMGGERPMHRFGATGPEDPVELSCDIHPWMEAWIYAFEHPHFTVTDASGRFALRDLAPGRHRLAIRHPAGGLARDEVVEVYSASVTRLDVAFTRADLRRRPR